MKYAMLVCLGTSNPDARRGAAMCISAIASIEIPAGLWVDLIDTLASNVDHDQANIRHASLQTIGFICEEV